MCNNQHSNNETNTKQWRNTTLVLSFLAILFSIGAIILSLGGVRVEITHETYIGTIVTLLGIMMTIVLGYQIINYLSFEKKVSQMIENRLDFIDQKMTFHKRETRVDIFLTLFRNSLYAPDWEISFSYIIQAINDIVYTEDSVNASIIIGILYKGTVENNLINFEDISANIISKLYDSLLNLSRIIDEDDQCKLKSVTLQIAKYINNSNS